MPAVFLAATRLLPAFECTALDGRIAAWFHQRLTPSFAQFLHILSFPGSGLWIGVVLGVVVAGLTLRRQWQRLFVALLSVPCGMLLGEATKQLVHRRRPYIAGPFVDWSGYSFPSGHTIGATLLYGMMVLFLLQALNRRRLQIAACSIGAMVILLVGFSRIALGAHYLSDVVAAMVLGAAWLVLCSRVIQAVNYHVHERYRGSRSSRRPRSAQDTLVASGNAAVGAGR